MQAWVESELQDSDLGDERLDKRYEARAEKGIKKAEWIVRACNERNLSAAAAADDDEQQQLWAKLESSEVLGTMEVQVRKNKPRSKEGKRHQPRSARTATLTIQSRGASCTRS